MAVRFRQPPQGKIAGHTFSDLSLAHTALRHAGTPEEFQQQEFLGDAVLQLVITEELMRRWPSVDEGMLTQMRIFAVNGESLAEHYYRLKLNEISHVGRGEVLSDGMAEDILEAVAGAIFLDTGYEACKKPILQWFAETLKQLSPQGDYRHPKTKLQELLQQHNCKLPEYELVKEVGVHKTVQCRFQYEGREYRASGGGRTVRRAERQAAENALGELTG